MQYLILRQPLSDKKLLTVKNKKLYIVGNEKICKNQLKMSKKRTQFQNLVVKISLTSKNKCNITT